MFELVRKHREREDGFTLIELLVVIAIISILAAIAIGAFTTQKAAAADASVQSDVRSTRNAIESMRVGEPDANHYAGSNAETGKKLTLTVGSTTATEPVSLSDGVQVRVSTHPSNPHEYVIDAWHEGAKQANGTDAVWRFDSLTGTSGLFSDSIVDPGAGGDPDGGDPDGGDPDGGYGDPDGGDPDGGYGDPDGGYGDPDGGDPDGGEGDEEIDWSQYDQMFGLPSGWYKEYAEFAYWVRDNAPAEADTILLDGTTGVVRFLEYNPAYNDWDGKGAGPPMYFEHGTSVYTVHDPDISSMDVYYNNSSGYIGTTNPELGYGFAFFDWLVRFPWDLS